MTKIHARVFAAITASLLAYHPSSFAEGGDQGSVFGENGPVRPIQAGAMSLKAASARSVASRATANTSATVFGGFELATAATVYILVRGNSLGTLGVTQGYLDAPRMRLYDVAGQDLFFDGNGRAGGNGCISSVALLAPVVSYYQNVRGQRVHDRDSCLAGTFAAGVYTFSVTPSIPGVTTATTQSVPTNGELLFEVTLGP